ncbi:MAG: DUF4907 domain-containing protein [Methanococcaceae archaeon]
MIKNIVIIFQSILIVILLYFFFWNRESSLSLKHKEKKESEIDIPVNGQSDLKLSFTLIESENNSWGYKIMNDSNLIIIQPNIPCLPGNEGFKTKEQARTVAELVISKIHKGETPPVVTMKDLEELGIL